MGSELYCIGRSAFKLTRIFQNDDTVIMEALLGKQRIDEGRLAG